MTEIDGHDVTSSLVEGEEGWWLATRGGPLAELAEQTAFDQLADETRDSGTGETGLAGNLGSAGGALVGYQFEGGAKVAAT